MGCGNSAEATVKEGAFQAEGMFKENAIQGICRGAFRHAIARGAISEGAVTTAIKGFDEGAFMHQFKDMFNKDAIKGVEKGAMDGMFKNAIAESAIKGLEAGAMKDAVHDLIHEGAFKEAITGNGVLHQDAINFQRAISDNNVASNNTVNTGGAVAVFGASVIALANSPVAAQLASPENLSLLTAAYVKTLPYLAGATATAVAGVGAWALKDRLPALPAIANQEPAEPPPIPKAPALVFDPDDYPAECAGKWFESQTPSTGKWVKYEARQCAAIEDALRYGGKALIKIKDQRYYVKKEGGKIVQVREDWEDYEGQGRRDVREASLPAIEY